MPEQRQLVADIPTTELLLIVAKLEVELDDARKAMTHASNILSARRNDQELAASEWRTAAIELRKRLARDLDA